MQSKTSYFNSTLFKKNLTRFWPLWGGASLIGALAPLALLVNLLQVNFNTNLRPLEMTDIYYNVLSWAVPGVSLVYAILCALAVWQYLYNARSVSLYHSLPITRKGLFVTNFLSGMAMMLIPYVVTGGLCILVSLLAGCFDPLGILVTVLGVLGDSFFFFSFATFIAFVTGNPFACAAFYFIFNFFFAAAEMLVDVFMSDFYFGVNMSYDGVLAFLSPVVFLMEKIHSYSEYSDSWTQGSYDRILSSVRLENGWMIAVYALVGVVFLACAWMLYKRRRSESAGDVVAVGWMKPVFRYGVALCCALAGGYLLYQILFEGFETGSTANAVPMAFSMVIAGVIGYYIATMLLAKSIKVFRGGTWKGAVGTAIAAAIVCGAIVMDPAGVESWVPKEGEFERVSIEYYNYYGANLLANVEDPATIQKILDLHQTIISEKDLLKDQNGDYRQIRLYYHQKDGGTVYRTYEMYMRPMANTETKTKAAALACDPVIQESNIFNNIQNNGIVSARLTSGYMEELYNTETKSMENMDLTREQAEALEAAIRRDIAAGHFGRTVFMEYNDFVHAAYRGNIQINYNLTYERENGTRSNYSDSILLSISTYCTETLQALEDLGILDETHKLLTRIEYDEFRDRERSDSSDGEYYEDYYEYAVYPEDSMVYPEVGY